MGGEEGGEGEMVQQQRPLVIGWFLHWDGRGPFITSTPPRHLRTDTKHALAGSGKQRDAPGRAFILHPGDGEFIFKCP